MCNKLFQRIVRGQLSNSTLTMVLIENKIKQYVSVVRPAAPLEEANGTPVENHCSRRLHVATELTEKYISNYFYNQFPASDSPNNELDYGNFNKIKSSATLRQGWIQLTG